MFGRMNGRKLVFMMSVSLDGFFTGPDRELDWQVVGDDLLSHFNDWLGKAGAFLDGRVTYELMAGHWPVADASPDTPPLVAEFARIWREMPKLVYSTTLDHADWNATVVREVNSADIADLKAQPGGDLVLGGADLAATFQRLDLIDEYRFYVQPVLLGRGRSFYRGDTARLQLVETVTFDGGVVLLRYTARKTP
jgi:dihydrofolate reductase